ncbi:MAG: histidine kinase [bacterium]
MKGSHLKRVIRNRVVQHLVFWILAFYVLLRIFTTAEDLLKIDLIYTTIFILTMLPGLYVNLMILIPNLLSRGRYIAFILLLTITMLLTAALNFFTFSYLIDYILPGYYFISYYDFIDLMKFMIVMTFVTTLLKLSKGWFQLLETRNQLSRLEKENAETKLLALKSQINPHFLFNSLSGIYALVLKKAPNAPEVILRLSDFLRYILYQASAPSVSLSSELAAMRDYVELQKLRAGKQSLITFEITRTEDDRQVVPLLFLPLIENCFKHGIKGETGPSFATIRFIAGQKTITGFFSNNKGKSEEPVDASFSGIGLKNLRDRLEMIFPGRYDLKIDDPENSFTVELTVPLYE